ncbi:NAD-dependent epimerase/dehydratase family protein [Skermania piniformis]|uniref:NAD-dependent epimerase/dehydratase family protein n=1 Tax=Skermania pinensis TaxID=39122 RepID=A0ABX8SA31_9ACTN|nr:NAD-dependent epimerase/dehydratase family protein [Skermania piniformis]QXQ13847.1 NAD-dependent epimerase/dehydratase family protein [Skermania piniformis]
MNETVLVTGGTGFVGGWTVVELLRQGYPVRVTVRDLSKEPALRAAIATEVDPADRLEVVAADLMSDDGWPAAVAGCRTVLHVASPLTATRDEQKVIRPAVDGVRRILRAARDGGARRVVYTSSCDAVYYGHPPRTTPFDESDWTNVDGGPMSAYVKSKALAERAAWDLMANEGGDLELTSVNPIGIFGPALSASATSSLGLIQRLLSGTPPLCPDLWFGVVDVRDVVDLHLRAMQAPEAAGQRYIATSGEPVSMLDVARALKQHLGPAAKRVPTRKAPDALVRLIGRFNVEMGDLVPLLGERRAATSAKARRELDWQPRPWTEAITASGESLIRLGVV